MIFSSDSHPKNVPFPISVIEEGIVISFNAKHPKNTEYPNFFTDDGIEICVKVTHLAKALL